MAKRIRTVKRVTKAEEAAAELAAAEAVEEMEGDSTDSILNSFDSDDDIENESNSNDVFEEGFKRAVAQKTGVRYHIKKNSEFLCTKGYPYSWEKLQADYGPGYYYVMAKNINNGRIMKQQTEMVGDPHAHHESEHDTEEVGKESNLAVLGWLQQSQERAEAKAQATAKSNENGMAQIFQAISVAQQKSSEMMMTLMMESSKQTQNLLITMMTAQQSKAPDPSIEIFKLLLLQKPVESGMKPLELVALLEKSKSEARREAKDDMKSIEERAKKLADEMTPEPNEGEESLTKTLIKGFVPVFAQIMESKQKEEQLQQAQLAEYNRRQQLAQGQGIQEGFIEDALQPGIRSRQQTQTAPRPKAPVQRIVRPEGAVKVVPPDTNSGLPIAEHAANVTGPKEVVGVDPKFRDRIFDFCAPDIAHAMVNRLPASKCAAVCLDKLEKEGVERQTVVKTFTLQDFYAYADKFGLPEEAKPWLKEFYESIALKAGEKPIRTATPATNGQSTAPSESVASGPVATVRGKAAGSAPRKQPGTNPQGPTA